MLRFCLLQGMLLPVSTATQIARPKSNDKPVLMNVVVRSTQSGIVSRMCLSLVSEVNTQLTNFRTAVVEKFGHFLP